MASERFTLVGDALRETSATPAQRAALYEVAARIPGIRARRGGHTYGYAGGTRTGYAEYLVQGVVDSKSARP